LSSCYLGGKNIALTLGLIRVLKPHFRFEWKFKNIKTSLRAWEIVKIKRSLACSYSLLTVAVNFVFVL